MTVDTGPADVHAGEVGSVRAPRHVTRWVVLGVLLVMLVVLACAGLLVRDALVARSALTRAAAQVPTVELALRERVAAQADPDGASAAAGAPIAESPELVELRRQTTIAREATDGPLWWIAARIPVVGPSAGAAADVATVLDDVTDDVLPPLAEVADAVATLERTDDGGFDLSALQAAGPGTTSARHSIDASLVRLDAIDTDALLPQLAEPVTTLRDRTDALATAVGTADRAAVLAPALLGADGPRTYLVLSMNPAELRAGGGIPGALLLVHVDSGRFEVVRQVPSSGVGPFPEPVLPLSKDDQEASTTRLGRFVQDVTSTPDFPTTASIAAEMWARDQGEQVDGVLATDPVALSYLLRSTGTIQVPVSPPVSAELGQDRVELTSDNAVDVLLRRAYDLLDPQTADVFFADVASAVISQASSDDVAPSGLMAAIQQATGEHRIQLWTADEDEQSHLDGTLVSGTFASSPRSADAVGVFFTDHVAGKMSAYLDARLEHVSTECTAGGQVDVLELRLASTAPEDAATVLPSYVAGLPGRAREPGTLSLGVMVAGPRGGQTPQIARDGNAFGGESRTWHDRSTLATTVVLAPGDSTTLRLEIPAAPGGGHPGSTPAGRLEVWSTPTTTLSGLHDVEVEPCG